MSKESIRNQILELIECRNFFVPSILGSRIIINTRKKEQSKAKVKTIGSKQVLKHRPQHFG